MISTRRIMVFTFLVMMVFVSTLEFSGTAYAAITPGSFVNKVGDSTNNPMCLGTKNGGTAEGTLAIVWACNGNPDQKWDFGPSPLAGDISIVNKKSGLCLSFPQKSVNVGINPIIRICNPSHDLDQSWWKQLRSGGANVFFNENSALCLGVYGTVKSGARPIQWGCNGHDDQRWSAVPL